MPAVVEPADLLKSWKEIASYLGRDVRTVIRWEKDKALPIHRAPGLKRAGTVFAYRSELDRWMMGNPDDSVAATREAPLLSRPQRSRWLAVAAIALVALIALLLTGFSKARHRGLALPLQLARTDYATSQNPAGILAVDVNKDGFADLIVANAKSESISVYLGRGDGTFAEPINTEGIPEYPTYFVVGDFNGDGKLDVGLHTKFGTSQFYVLLGDGAGHFRRTVEQALPGGNKGVTGGDLNGDGKTDIVITRNSAKLITVLLGNGDGTFRSAVDLPTTVSAGPTAIADLNGDGHPDIAVADYNVGTGRTVTVFLGNGDGTFSPGRSFPTGGGPLHIAVADVNEDGKQDLVTADFQAGVSVLLGNGDGSFREPREFPAGKANTFVAITDFDQDGHLDILALGMHDDALTFLRGHGNGDFDPPQKFATGRYPDVIAIGDFDRDGRPDLAVTNGWANSVSVYLNRSERRSTLASLISR